MESILPVVTRFDQPSAALHVPDFGGEDPFGRATILSYDAPE